MIQPPKIWRSALIPGYIDEYGNCQMMFMVPNDPTYGGSAFQVAKGRIEDGEDPLTTALREADEELGLIEDNVERVFDCGVWLGRTHVFAAIIKDPANFKSPNDDETKEVKWMTTEEFMAEGRDIHRDVVRHVSTVLVASYVNSFSET